MGVSEWAGGASYRWHTHRHDELCLVTAGRTVIGHAGRRRPADAGSLFLFRRGERHGFWNEPEHSCELAVLHFASDDSTYADLNAPRAGDAHKRVWQLDEGQQEAWLAVYHKVLAEHVLSRPGSRAAQSAWLRLLLVTTARLGAVASDPLPTPRRVSADVQAMWRVINTHSGDQRSLLDKLNERFANYDSLRHAFAREIGSPPTQVWRELRLVRAGQSLIGTTDTIKQIAAEAGYARQHEFTRAFTRRYGLSPTRWRARHLGE